MKITLFTCVPQPIAGGESKDDFHLDSHFKSGDFESFLDPVEHGLETVELYGYEIRKNCCIDELSHLFELTKQYINVFRAALVRRSRKEGINVDWSYLRREILRFMHLLKTGFFELSDYQRTLHVFIELKNLVFFIGRFSNLSFCILTELFNSNRPNSPEKLYFHLYLDMWLNLMQIFIRINHQSQLEFNIIRDVNYMADFRSQLIELIIGDLIAISLRKFNRLSDISDIHTHSPFVCSCMKEFYVIIRCIVDEDEVFGSLHPFWLHFNKIVDSITHGSPEDDINLLALSAFNHIPFGLQIKTNIEVGKFWIMSNLMQIFQYDKQNRRLLDVKTLKSNDLICNSQMFAKLAANILKQEELKNRYCSTTVLSILHLSTRCISFCGACIDLLLPFVDFLFKSIYKPNQNQAILTPKSAYQWKCKLANNSGKRTTIDFEDMHLTLFESFLRKVAEKLMCDESRQAMSHWQKLKGRLYSKIQPKRIEEMDQGSLYKLASIFLNLCLSSGANWPEVSEKLLDLGKIVFKRSPISDRSVLILKAIFCAIHLFPDRDCTSFIKYNCSVFDKLCQHLASMDNVPNVRRNALTDVIFSYLDEVNGVLETNGTLVDSSKLLSPNIVLLLSKSIDRELLALIKIFDKFVASVKSLVLRDEFNGNQNLQNLLGFCIEHLLPYVKRQFSNRQYQFDLTKMAVNLTTFVPHKENYRNASSDFRMLFFSFSSNPRSNINDGSKYYDLIFSDSSSLVQQEICLLFPEIIEKILRGNELHQEKMKDILDTLIDHLRLESEDDPTMQYLLPALKQFVRKFLVKELPIKVMRTLIICCSLNPHMKNELVPVVLETIKQIEKSKCRGIDDALRNAFTKFVHQQNL